MRESTLQTLSVIVFYFFSYRIVLWKPNQVVSSVLVESPRDLFFLTHEFGEGRENSRKPVSEYRRRRHFVHS